MCQQITSGREFGWLIAVAPIKGGKFWTCDCKCGKKNVKASKWHLLHDKRRSCGCRKRDKEDEIKCCRCDKNKPRDAYYLRKNGSLFYSSCKSCILKREKINGKARHHQRRLDALIHYSNGDLKCACCDEKAIEFLCLDHADNSGARHRKELGKLNIYRWLKRMNYPDMPLRVLCFNCNQARGAYGYCPHELVSMVVSHPVSIRTQK